MVTALTPTATVAASEVFLLAEHKVVVDVGMAGVVVDVGAAAGVVVDAVVDVGAAPSRSAMSADRGVGVEGALRPPSLPTLAATCAAVQAVTLPM